MDLVCLWRGSRGGVRVPLPTLATPHIAPNRRRSRTKGGDRAQGGAAAGGGAALCGAGVCMSVRHYLRRAPPHSCRLRRSRGGRCAGPGCREAKAYPAGPRGSAGRCSPPVPQEPILPHPKPIPLESAGRGAWPRASWRTPGGPDRAGGPWWPEATALLTVRVWR
jgi:hypothetical protein